MFELNEKDPRERSDFARYRAGLYRSASSVFLRELTDEELSTLICAARMALSEGSSWVLVCERELLAHLASYDDADLVMLGARLRSEYAELFLGPRPPLAPCFESMYVGSPRRLFTDVTRSVRDAYESNGIAVVKRNRVPDDHIGYELEFMARMADLQAQAATEGRAADEADCAAVQVRFLSEHLGSWVGSFLERMERAACADFYRAWARFVVAFVEEDARLALACKRGRS